jgi:hypothetical protein
VGLGAGGLRRFESSLIAQPGVSRPSTQPIRRMGVSRGGRCQAWIRADQARVSASQAGLMVPVDLHRPIALIE